jgi:hypothetical protein
MSSPNTTPELRDVVIDMVCDTRQIVSDDGSKEEYIIPYPLMERLCVAAGFSGIADAMRAESENWNRAHG